jgi:hypothetical protein
MNPWLESSGVLLLGIVGVALGCCFSRLPKLYWSLGYFIPLTLIVLVGLAYRFRTLELCPPFCWLMAGRREFALTALISTMVLTTPISRLRLRRDRVATSLLMVWVVFQVAAWPFLAPAFNRDKLPPERQADTHTRGVRQEVEVCRSGVEAQWVKRNREEQKSRL